MSYARYLHSWNSVGAKKGQRWKHLAESFPKTKRSVLAPSWLSSKRARKTARGGCGINHRRIWYWRMTKPTIVNARVPQSIDIGYKTHHSKDMKIKMKCTPPVRSNRGGRVDGRCCDTSLQVSHPLTQRYCRTRICDRRQGSLLPLRPSQRAEAKRSPLPVLVAFGGEDRVTHSCQSVRVRSKNHAFVLTPPLNLNYSRCTWKRNNTC